MLNKLLMTTAALFVGSSAGFAQSFSGAELGIEYSDVTDEEDLGSISYYGSGQFELLYGFSVAGDFSLYDFEVDSDTYSNLTGHVIYTATPTTDIGLFFGQDSTDGDTSTLFGAELAYDFGVGDFEVYIGSADDPLDREATLLGAGVDYDFGNGFGFEASFDRIDGDDFDANTGEIGAYYMMAQGPRFGATIGTIDQEDGNAESSETYFALKASIAVGNNGGVSFGPRGVYEVVKNTIGIVQ